MEAIELEWENVQYRGKYHHPLLGVVSTYGSGLNHLPSLGEDR